MEWSFSLSALTVPGGDQLTQLPITVESTAAKRWLVFLAGGVVVFCIASAVEQSPKIGGSSRGPWLAGFLRELILETSYHIYT